MSEPIVFREAVQTYDSTRAWPEEVMDSFASAVERLAGGDGTLLEIGVGTGRIALPLIRLGMRLAGVEVSRDMLSQMRSRLSPDQQADLLLGDATSLPFKNASFAVVLEFHVLHLVAQWRQLLCEVRRVLGPGGSGTVFIRRSGDPSPDALWYRIRQEWYAICARHDIPLDWQRPGPASSAAIDAELLGLGGSRDRLEVGRWIRAYTPRGIIEDVVSRVDFSRSISETTRESCLTDLWTWTRETFGDVDETHEEEASLQLDLWRFDGA
jgi:SAM-dependent methyltransferase